MNNNTKELLTDEPDMSVDAHLFAAGVICVMFLLAVLLISSHPSLIGGL